jgi:hypothetical protein
LVPGDYRSEEIFEPWNVRNIWEGRFVQG